MDTYENQGYEQGRALLEKDRLSYAVMYDVIGGPVKKIITDHKRIMIAHTAMVYPTWIWAPEDVKETELELIFQTVLKEFSPLCEYRFNTKYSIAEYLIRKFTESGQGEWKIATNIVAYECQAAQEPVKKVDGKLETLDISQEELSARLIEEASLAIGDRIFSREESLEAAREQLKRQVLYVWRNAEGKAVSFCDRNEDGNHVKISQCYTPEEERGKGYAARMIYELCRDALAKGQVPMLYADADYESSNRCYQKIGFEAKGKIATIGSVK